MLIVDSQVHIWGNNLPTNPAHRQITAYSVEDLLKEMEEAGVEALDRARRVGADLGAGAEAAAESTKAAFRRFLRGSDENR